MSRTQDVIVRLLRSIGTRKEVEQYLRQFASVDSRKFAIITVAGGVLQRELDGLASSLTFLHQVGLQPIVIHGAGPQLDEALAASGVVTPRVGGVRIMPPAALEVARRVLQRENLRLCEALEEMGTRARPITTGVFEAEAVDRDRLGLVGRVVRINLEAIESSLRAGHLPILACLGETPSGQILNINAVLAARALAAELGPYKVVFLNERGGLVDGQGEVISAINLVEDAERLRGDPTLPPGTRRKLEEIQQLLDALPPSSSVSITSPDHLARELFTHRGSGTLVRQGERVTRHDTLAHVDRERLRALLEEGFQRRLDPHYFDNQPFYRIYLADSYRATAILTLEGDIPYLDKFATTQEAQGLGVGGSIWARMQRENPKLYWRSRNDNPINPWYFERSQGAYRSGYWTVFWYGLDGFDEARVCVERALARPATFITPQPGGAMEPEPGHRS